MRFLNPLTSNAHSLTTNAIQWKSICFIFAVRLSLAQCYIVVGTFGRFSCGCHSMEEITVSNDMEIGNSCAAYSIEYIKMDVPFNIIWLNVTLSLKLCRTTVYLCATHTHTHTSNTEYEWKSPCSRNSITCLDGTQNESATTWRHFTFLDVHAASCRLRNDYDMSFNARNL